MIDDGTEESLEWVDHDEPRTIYPEFFRTELRHTEGELKYFITDERLG